MHTAAQPLPSAPKVLILPFISKRMQMRLHAQFLFIGAFGHCGHCGQRFEIAHDLCTVPHIPFLAFLTVLDFTVFDQQRRGYSNDSQRFRRALHRYSESRQSLAGFSAFLRCLAIPRLKLPVTTVKTAVGRQTPLRRSETASYYPCLTHLCLSDGLSPEGVYKQALLVLLSSPITCSHSSIEQYSTISYQLKRTTTTSLSA